MIHLDFINDSHGCGTSLALDKLFGHYLLGWSHTRGLVDASQDTELVLNSNWHSTGSLVCVTGVPEKRDQVQSLLDPLRLLHMAKPCVDVISQGKEGLAARLTLTL